MKQMLVQTISERFKALGIPFTSGDRADFTLQTEFLDAGWSTGAKKITYEATVFLDEEKQTAFMWEKTTEVGQGFSFDGDSESSFQSGTTLYRKVKSVQYGPDGKAYEISLDLGAIPKTVKDAAKSQGWDFKTVLKQEKALFPVGYYPPPMNQVPAPAAQPPLAAPRFCTQCGSPLKEGANFCSNCGKPRG